jgi:hypothetical protein
MRDAGTFNVPDYQGNALEQITKMVEAYLRNVVNRTPSSRAFLQLSRAFLSRLPALIREAKRSASAALSTDAGA